MQFVLEQPPRRSIDYKKRSMMQHLLQCLTSRTNNKRILGAVFFTAGLTLLFLKRWIWEIVAASIVLKPNSELTEMWIKIPEPVPTDIYIFNWTNPEEFLNHSAKPKFEEVGPYRYMQLVEKTNLAWNSNNTVTFNNRRTWYLNEKQTNRSIYDNFVTLNIINVLVTHYIRNWNYLLKKLYSTYLHMNASPLYITRTADQLISQGFDDFIVDLYNYLPFLGPEIPRFNKFGYLYLRNASDTFEGVFNMGTGINGNFDILSWNYQNTTPYYDGTCARVHGSGGELYSRKLSKNTVRMFAADICRSAPLDFEDEVYVNGILGYKFTARKTLLDNGTLNPENVCQCAGECIPSGMLNLSSCRYGLPVFFSLPHYYGADPVYLDAVEGLHPDRDKHETYVIIEPHTSLLLKASIAIQLNLLVHPVEHISMYDQVPKIFFPLLWAREEAVLPDSVFLILRLYLSLPYIIIGFSLMFICLGLYLQFFAALKPKLMYIYNKKISKSDVNKVYRKVEIPLKMDVECEEMERLTESI